MAFDRGLCRAAGAVALALVMACGTGPTLEEGSSLRGRENCANGIDDDADKKIDCADEDCSTSCLGLSQRPPPSFDSCAESAGDREAYPVDMIFMLDSSPSMEIEIQIVADNLDRLGNALRALDVNAHFVMLGGPDVCVPPPLGGPDCQNSEGYRHVAQPLGNQETLRSPVDLYLQYHDFLRRNADRVLIAVSDDNPSSKAAPGWPSGVTASTFDRRLRSLGDRVFADYVFHSIAAFSTDGGLHPRGCRGAQRNGTTYLQLTEQTDGLKFSICNSQQSEWQRFFSDVAKATAQDVHVPCEYARIVIGEDGVSTDPNIIEVHAQTDGRWRRLSELDDLEDCAEPGGFAVEGDSILLCPSSCLPPEVTRVLVYRGCYEDPIKDPD